MKKIVLVVVSIVLLMVGCTSKLDKDISYQGKKVLNVLDTYLSTPTQSNLDSVYETAKEAKDFVDENNPSNKINDPLLWITSTINILEGDVDREDMLDIRNDLAKVLGEPERGVSDK